uniref:E4 protein n=1 Tax=Human papillomavirus TaxID=10566 RepID=A0A385PIM0_9PAPI|nr:MAG: E4 protein [Human papillomavirus]
MYGLIICLLTPFLTQTGIEFIIKMKRTIGMLHKDEQTLMDFTLMTLQAKEIILHCLLLMLKGLAPQDTGLLILKMKLFLLSIVHKGHLPTSLLKDPLLPPGTPYPGRKHTPADATKEKRESLAQPPRRPPNYDVDDDDENKENHPPDDDRKGYGKSVVESLLRRLEEDLQLYQEEVLHELNDLRRKLEIPQF